MKVRNKLIINIITIFERNMMKIKIPEYAKKAKS